MRIPIICNANLLRKEVYMSYNSNIRRRHSIRLKNYDYSKEGMYFITICVQNRECILSEIVNIDDVGAGLVSAR